MGEKMSYRIYLVEDDENLNLVLSSYLEREGWQVRSFLKGLDAEAQIEDSPDLWILDIMLPDIDGYQLIKKIKDFDQETPVIFISARDADIDRVVGLELGSNDYLAKPFLPRELVIRSKNLLERYDQPKSKLKKIASYTIDLGRRTVIENGDKNIELTSKEFDLLLYLVDNLDLALSRHQILSSLWGEDYYGSDRVVDDFVRRLRKKLPDLNLETVYGYGYKVLES